MKAIILVFVAALRLTVVADEPQTLSAVQARAIYEKSITLADTSRAEAVQAAKDDALTELASALDTSLKNKNRKEANVIATAIKSLTENSVLEAGLLPAIDTIREGYEGRVVSAHKQHTEQISPARTKYLAALETAMDAAFVAKDLEEVNRIDAAIEPLRAEATRVENTIGMSFKRLPIGPLGDFSIGVHEVTQSEYEQVMGDNPSEFKGVDNPVEMVSWHDAVAFCEKLSALPAEVAAGRVYRLPTAAEWEYACRAGTTTEYSFGDNEKDLGNYAWYATNSGGTTHGVGEKLPNVWGLYDMHGNVWEWCEDKVGSSRVVRGNSYRSDSQSCEVARANNHRAKDFLDRMGFRLALNSPHETAMGTPPAAKEPAVGNLAGGEHVVKQNKVTFMEVAGVGHTVVYVIDNSNSMVGKYIRMAKSQLKASLQLLQPNQKFAVIFYNESRERLKWRRQDDQSMYFATDVNKELAGDEVDRFTSGRGTQHMPALLEAISLKPDVIYFVTDGKEPELSPAQLAEIRRLAGSLTIHVVKFFGDGTLSSRGPTWLERLASQSNGEYREINIDTFLNK